MNTYQEGEAVLPGVYTDLDSAKYHAAPGLSKSGLDQFRKSPAHYQAWLNEEGKDTPALRFGRLAHMSLFEPEKFLASTAIAPLVDRRTKEGKSIWEQFKAQNEGKELITVEEREKLLAMGGMVRRHPVAGAMLKNGAPETSVFAKDPANGLTLKCRFDWLTGDGGVDAVDYKTTDDASPSAFVRSVVNYRYHVQQVHYSYVSALAGREIRSFTFIAQEKEPPYAVACYRIDPADITLAAVEHARQLEAFASCEQFQSWPGYSTDLQTLTLPKWAAGQSDNTSV